MRACSQVSVCCLFHSAIVRELPNKRDVALDNVWHSEQCPVRLGEQARFVLRLAAAYGSP